MAQAVVLTALGLECGAITRLLSGGAKVTAPAGTVYATGTFEEWSVAVAEIGPGNTAAAIEVERAIAMFHADCALFVGIAGGLKDVRLGDVVSATKVYGYESGKQTTGFLPRPDVGQVSHRLEQAARAVRRDATWLERVESGESPNAFIGPIAAGEKVVASARSPLYRFLQRSYSDALAVEMEGRGFLQGAFAHRKCEALVIRGISDLIEGKAKADKRGWQEKAAHHATAFAFDLLSVLSELDDRRCWSINIGGVEDDEIAEVLRVIRKTVRAPRITFVKASREANGSLTLQLESSGWALDRVKAAFESGQLEAALGRKVGGISVTSGTRSRAASKP